MTVGRAIILAAGRGQQVDGHPKVLLTHPKTRKSILEHATEAFAGKTITVVVGYRAVQVMERFPKLDYVLNSDWALSNNALSLALALSDEPSYVVSGDIFFSPDLIQALDGAGPNVVLTDRRENRALTAIHCQLREDGSISSTYQGPVKDMRDPEAVGLFKIEAPAVLQRWKRRSLEHGNLFVGQTLPFDLDTVQSFDRGSFDFDEINTPADYLRLIEKSRGR